MSVTNDVHSFIFILDNILIIYALRAVGKRHRRISNLSPCLCTGL